MPKCLKRCEAWPVNQGRRSASAVRDQIDDIIVQLRHCRVERGESAPAGSRELGQVSVGELAMPDDSLNGNIGVRNIVGPEFVPWVGGGDAEDRLRGRGRLAFANEQAHQATLGDRAGRKVIGYTDEPVLRGHMVDVIVNEQSDEHVGVEQNRHWS